MTISKSLIILDSEWSDECIDFTMCFFLCLPSPFDFRGTKIASIFFNSIFSDRKVNLDGTLGDQN